MSGEAKPVQAASQQQPQSRRCGPIARSVAVTIALGLITALGAVFLYANAHNVSALLDLKVFSTGIPGAIVWVVVGSVATLGGIWYVKVCKDRRSIRPSRWVETSGLTKAGKNLLHRSERTLRRKAPFLSAWGATKKDVKDVLQLLQSKYGKKHTFAYRESKTGPNKQRKIHITRRETSQLTKEGKALLADCKSIIQSKNASILKVPVAEGVQDDVDNVLPHLGRKYGNKYTFAYAKGHIVASHIFTGEVLKEYERVRAELIKKQWCATEHNIKYIQQLHSEPDLEGCSFTLGETAGIARQFESDSEGMLYTVPGETDKKPGIYRSGTPSYPNKRSARG